MPCVRQPSSQGGPAAFIFIIITREVQMTTTVAPALVDARKLAWLAEEAHGLQGEELALVQPEGEGDPVLKPKEEIQATDHVLLRVFTEGRDPPMIPPDKVVLGLPGGKEIRVDEIYGGKGDALFWSASAVEKFLFPYYSSQRLLTPQEMGRLKAEYQKAGVVAMLHVAPSKAYALRSDPFKVLKAPDQLIGLREFVRSLEK
jgi:hypothetical protein